MPRFTPDSVLTALTAITLLSIGTVASPPLEAAEPVRLVTDFAVSPDGRTLVLEWAGDVWTAPLAGGSIRPVTRDPALDRQPCFSPDGTEIAFVSNREGYDQVYTVPVTGGSPVPRTRHSEGYQLLEYSPVGDAFITMAQRDHFWRAALRPYRVQREGKNADELLFDAEAREVRLSPEGTRLLVAREGTSWFRKGYRGSQAGQIWLYDLDAQSFSELLHDELGFRYPRWKPDGNGFYYVGQQSGSFNLWEYELATGSRRQLTFFEDDTVFWPEVSRNGEVIVFRHLFDLYRFRPGRDEAPQRIELEHSGEPVAPAERRQQLTSATAVAASADGLEIAFIAGGDLWVMDTELREPRQITRTPEAETSPLFSADQTELYVVSDAGGQSDIWRVRRARPDRYWWQNDEFELTQLTTDPEVESDLSLSPDGRQLAYVRGRGDLMISSLDGATSRCLFESWNEPSYDWSPDGKWLAYAVDDNDFNRDVWVVPVDASRPAFNVSTHPDNDFSPSWSPDGRLLAFTGRRQEDEVDIYYVWLRAADHELDSRDRKLEKALEKMSQKRKAKLEPSDPPNPAEPTIDPTEPTRLDRAGAPEPPLLEAGPGAGGNRAKSKKAAPPQVEIDFDGLRERVRRISIPNSRESNLVWIGDSKLAFSASLGSDAGTYTVEFPDELAPKKLSTTAVSRARWLPEAKQLLTLNRGVPGVVNDKGTLTSYSFDVRQRVQPAARYRAGFELAWRTLRDTYYDEALGNRDWNQVLRKYVDVAAASVDDDAFEHVVQLLLGELNGSHLGFSASWTGYRSEQPWNDQVAHLGLRYEPQHRGPGWRVKDVIRGGPTDEVGSRVAPGETLLEIDRRPVDPSVREGDVLSGAIDRDVELRVRGVEGTERTVRVRPITYGAARGLLYDEWIERNRRRVADGSGDSLGYLHIRGMNWPSFLRFEEELYRVGAGKSGLIIDVRANGGGSTTDHLLTALTQPDHAITVPRGGGPGYPQDRRVYATWSKPIVVLCDQNSFSNAEIFAHAVRTLRRGRVVGVPTAGGVISTGGQSVLDLGTIRTPFRGWYVLSDGRDMEMNGAQPDVVVWNEPGTLPTFRDAQLDRATTVLLEDVGRWQQRPRAHLQKAPRRGDPPSSTGTRARF